MGGWMVDKTGYDIKCGLINATGYTIIINGSSTTEPSFRLKRILTKFNNIQSIMFICLFDVPKCLQNILGISALDGVSELRILYQVEFLTS